MISLEDKTFLQIALFFALITAAIFAIFAGVIAIGDYTADSSESTSTQLQWFAVMFPFIGFSCGFLIGWGMAIYYSARNIIVKWLYWLIGSVIPSAVMFGSLFLGDLLADYFFSTDFGIEANPFLTDPIGIFLILYVVSFLIVPVAWVFAGLFFAMGVISR